MSAEAFILDGYVDEPACLGVPPYISPYIRTVAGALIGHRFTVHYLTIDQLRKDPRIINLMDRANLLVMIAGVTVPGKYLGGTPATLNEIQQVGHILRGPRTLLGGRPPKRATSSRGMAITRFLLLVRPTQNGMVSS